MQLQEAKQNVGKKLLVNIGGFLREGYISQIDPSGTAMMLSDSSKGEEGRWAFNRWEKLDDVQLISVLNNSVNESGKSGEQLIQG